MSLLTKNMKHFPSFCIDNFYPDPDAVRRFALSQEFQPEDGSYPGSRTKNLDTLDRSFFDYFCNKLFSVFYNFNKSHVSWSIKTNFQLIPAFDSNPLSPKNTGWIHYDDNCVFAGIIFLNPVISLNCGTSLFKLTDSAKLYAGNAKKEFYKHQIDNEYDKHITNHNSAFIETTRFNNVYNRLIGFDGELAHGVNSFYNSASSEPRLTQVFFCKEIVSDDLSPLERSRKC
jgi:hypothetical protein